MSIFPESWRKTCVSIALSSQGIKAFFFLLISQKKAKALDMKVLVLCLSIFLCPCRFIPLLYHYVSRVWGGSKDCRAYPACNMYPHVFCLPVSYFNPKNNKKASLDFYWCLLGLLYPPWCWCNMTWQRGNSYLKSWLPSRDSKCQFPSPAIINLKLQKLNYHMIKERNPESIMAIFWWSWECPPPPGRQPGLREQAYESPSLSQTYNTPDIALNIHHDCSQKALYFNMSFFYT